MPDATLAAKTIRYVIVVHGMGEARQNETALGVITRFADARSDDDWPPPSDVLTLGMACGQTGISKITESGIDDSAARGQPWMEFKHIPIDPDPRKRKHPPFLGEPAAPSTGENVRFVDVHWNDLLAGSYESVGQQPEVWVDGLLGRLRRKAEAERRGNRNRTVPVWALEILGVLQQTIRVVRFWTKYRAAELDETVFGKYLGDVQLYGEYAQVRGTAVRRFHQIVHAIEERHRDEPGVNVRYTVIAHSLGTIMSMDALLYAHATPAAKFGARPGADACDLPWPGYLSNHEREVWLRELHGIPSANHLERETRRSLAFANTSWVQRVDSFVTLGSPIDKFLTIWWLNYQHLADASWIDRTISANRIAAGLSPQIEHFNYCEEQDPVGHNLDLAHTAPAVTTVFTRRDDIVYTRYAIPGLAHVAYWRDQELFNHIICRAVDAYWPGRQPAPAQSIKWFDLAVFRRAMRIIYLWAPLAIVVLDAFTFTLAYRSDSLHTAAIAAVGFFGATILGRYVLDLLIWWRQVLKSKQNKVAPLTTPAPAGDAQGEPQQHQQHQKNVATCAGVSDVHDIPPEALAERQSAERRTRRSLLLWQFVPLALCTFAATPMFLLDLQRIDWWRLVFIAMIGAICQYIWDRLFHAPNSTWRSQQREEERQPAQRRELWSRITVQDFSEERSPSDFAQVRDKAVATAPDAQALLWLMGALFASFCVARLCAIGLKESAWYQSLLESDNRRFGVLFVLAVIFGTIAVVFGYVRQRHKEIRSSFHRDRDHGQLKRPSFVAGMAEPIDATRRADDQGEARDADQRDDEAGPPALA